MVRVDHMGCGRVRDKLERSVGVHGVLGKVGNGTRMNQEAGGDPGEMSSGGGLGKWRGKQTSARFCPPRKDRTDLERSKVGCDQPKY